jgi:hypothetical protein
VRCLANGRLFFPLAGGPEISLNLDIFNKLGFMFPDKNASEPAGFLPYLADFSPWFAWSQSRSS